MAYADYEEFDAVLDEISPEDLERIYADKGFVVLAWADGGWVHFFTKSPVRTPDDLKALKLFAWAGDDLAIELWKAAGFNPVPLPATEISTALQTGLSPRCPTSPQAAVLLQWYDQAKYMTDVNWAVLLGGIVVSKSSWEKIPADLRPALAEGGAETRAQAPGPDAGVGGERRRGDGEARPHRGPPRCGRHRRVAARRRGGLPEAAREVRAPRAVRRGAEAARRVPQEAAAAKAGGK